MNAKPGKAFAMVTALCLAVLLSQGSTGVQASDDDSQLYTAYNIWYEQLTRIWSTISCSSLVAGIEGRGQVFHPRCRAPPQT